MSQAILYPECVPIFAGRPAHHQLIWRRYIGKRRSNRQRYHRQGPTDICVVMCVSIERAVSHFKALPSYAV